MKLLILYLTKHGLTEKLSYQIARWMEAESLLATKTQEGHPLSCDIYNLGTLPLPIPWSNYHAVIIAIPVYYGRFSKRLYQFIDEHASALKKRPSAFICTNLSARKPNRNSPNTNPYLQRFLKNSPWQPDKAMVFAGALDYSLYQLWERWIIRAIMMFTGGETDTKTKIEYTPWEAVHEWSKQLYHDWVLRSTTSS